MPQRLPSPVALRAFEASARHLSFTRAGLELNVTQAAVSHQVKALERDIGVYLFRRLPRGLVLTDEGESLQEIVGNAFAAISDRVAEIRDGAAIGGLTIGLNSYFSVLWLSRRLGRFWRQHPEIHLRLHHSLIPTNFRRNGAEVAIAWGDGNWPGLETCLLLRSEVSPVCSPALTQGNQPLKTPSDLNRFTLLHGFTYDSWTQWLAAVGADDVNPRQGPIIDDSNVVLHAAIEGQGVAIGANSLVAEEIAAGRLIQPFDVSVDTGEAYYIVYPQGALERLKVYAFCKWIMLEAGWSKKAIAKVLGKDPAIRST